MKKLYIERFYLNRGRRRIPYDCTYHPAIEGCRTDTHLRGTDDEAQVAAFCKKVTEQTYPDRDSPYEAIKCNYHRHKSINLRLVVIVPDKQGYSCECYDKFEGYDKDVIHNGHFYKLGEMAHIQLLRLHVGASA